MNISGTWNHCLKEHDAILVHPVGTMGGGEGSYIIYEIVTNKKTWVDDRPSNIRPLSMLDDSLLLQGLKWLIRRACGQKYEGRLTKFWIINLAI